MINLPPRKAVKRCSIFRHCTQATAKRRMYMSRSNTKANYHPKPKCVPHVVPLKASTAVHARTHTRAPI